MKGGEFSQLFAPEHFYKQWVRAGAIESKQSESVSHSAFWQHSTSPAPYPCSLPAATAPIFCSATSCTHPPTDPHPPLYPYSTPKARFSHFARYIEQLQLLYVRHPHTTLPDWRSIFIDISAKLFELFSDTLSASNIINIPSKHPFSMCVWICYSLLVARTTIYYQITNSACAANSHWHLTFRPC